MKSLARISPLLLLAFTASFTISCSDDENNDPSTQEEQFDKLKSTWVMTSAELSGDDETSDFVNVEMTVSGNFVEGGEYPYTFSEDSEFPDLSPWPVEGGYFSFGTDATSQLIRIDNDGTELDMNYTLTDDDQTLTITFTYSGTGYNGGGRAASVEGDWEFVFSKQ